MVHSLRTGTIPEDWKNANIHAIYKKGDKSLASNYRPISLTSLPCKIMEHILFHQIMSHLDKHDILTDVQHGFRKSHSCETQLITTIEEIARNLDQGSQTDAILLDFSKAFDIVPHQRLLLKLDRYGLRGEIKGWIQAWLCDKKQTVVVDGDKSAPVKVKSGVPQGTVLGPLMFLFGSCTLMILVIILNLKYGFLLTTRFYTQ